MKKSQTANLRFQAILLFSLAIGLVTGTSKARAAEGKVKTSILFNCTLSFNAKGRSTYLVLGATHLKGEGKLACYDYLRGVTETIPLEVSVQGPGVGLGITGFNISGGAAGIGLNGSPDALLGRYAMIRANVAVGVGVAAGPTLRLAKDSINLGVQIEGTSGLGAGIDALSVELKRAASHQNHVWGGSKGQSAPQVSVVSAPTPEEVVTIRYNQQVRLVDENGVEIRRYTFRRNN